MPSRAAVLIAVVLVSSTLVAVAARSAPATGDGPSASTTPPAQPGAKPPAGESRRTPHAAKDPDQELIDHLDEIERLELLQNLDLFDTAAPRPPDR